jgi:hypothetical protein
MANHNIKNEILEIVTSLYYLAKNHKKTFVLVLLFEFWVHSLMFQHLAELKTLWQLIPFIGG